MTSRFDVYQEGYKDQRDVWLDCFNTRELAIQYIDLQDAHLGLNYYIREVHRPSATRDMK